MRVCLWGFHFQPQLNSINFIYLLGLHSRQSYLIVIKNRVQATLIHFALSTAGPRRGQIYGFILQEGS